MARQRNKIYAIVEGHGEANSPPGGGKPAVVVLIGRIPHDLGYWRLFPAEKTHPFRMAYGRFFRGDHLERAIRYHKKMSDCGALLILLDMDDDCPKEKAAEISARKRKMEALPFTVTVVCAKREYESWFLASLETIIEGKSYPGSPEDKRDAKGWLRKAAGYRQTRHQAAYTGRIDFSIAKARSRSFRRMYHALEEIVDAHQQARVIVTPD